jgi:hypothetical protein
MSDQTRGRKTIPLVDNSSLVSPSSSPTPSRLRLHQGRRPQGEQPLPHCSPPRCYRARAYP